VFIFLFAACASAGQKPEPTKHYKETILKKTEKGLFSVEMLIPERELMMGVNEVDVIVHDRKDKDVPGAEITVTPWMPEMGHGVLQEPVVLERGGGLYSVKNIVLIMTGHWELRIKISKDGAEDKAVFDFPGVAAPGHARGMAPPAPSDLDLSTSALSENKVFRVSYASASEPVPINRVHSWTLTVLTGDGQPVRDAHVTLVGDMPEHGHGFPTEPEVTEQAAAGAYIVEGMKFSMPGWWFYIEAGDRTDSVSFNLFLR
jgi:hypothetical protein